MPGSMLKACPARSGSVVAGDEVRLLVRLQPDAVAEPMDELVAVAAVADDLARDLVEGRAGTPGRTAAVAAAWAARTSSKTARNSGVGPRPASPPVTHSIRVMSEP